jgi:hypothetical protein
METRSLMVEMFKRIALGWTLLDKYAIVTSGAVINFDYGIKVCHHQGLVTRFAVKAIRNENRRFGGYIHH